jgi:hypothetical protein
MGNILFIVLTILIWNGIKTLFVLIKSNYGSKQSPTSNVRAPKKIEYLFNGKRLDKSLFCNAVETLGLSYNSKVNMGMVYEAFERQTEMLLIDHENGVNVKTTPIDLVAAKEYIIDWGNYYFSAN